MLTLIRDLGSAAALTERSPEYRTRPVLPEDTVPLGALYFEAYDPGVACDSLEAAIADIAATFRGAYGTLLPEASLLITDRGGPVAAILTVERAPWDDTPDCPFIIELFTARRYRRRGLAGHLVAEAVSAVAGVGHRHIALRVSQDNAPARGLYSALGFEEWHGR